MVVGKVFVKGATPLSPLVRGAFLPPPRRAHGLYPPDKGGQGGWFPAEGGRAGRVKYYSLRLPPPSFLAMNAPSPVAFDPQPPLSGGLFFHPLVGGHRLYPPDKGGQGGCFYQSKGVSPLLSKKGSFSRQSPHPLAFDPRRHSSLIPSRRARAPYRGRTGAHRERVEGERPSIQTLFSQSRLTFGGYSG